MEASGICIFCSQPIEEGQSVTLTEKGCRGINRASEARKDRVSCVPGQQVHQECRRKYCHPREVAKALNKVEQHCSTSATEGLVLRSAEKRQFQFNTDCLTFRSTAKAVLQDFYQQEKKKADPDVEKIRVVETAAKLI